MIDEEKEFRRIMSIFIIALIIIGTAYTMCSCTVSFQNISTHGTATDLVDETQKVEPDVQTDLTIPTKVLP